MTRARAAGRAAHTRRRRASLRALRWGPGIIASPVGFPDRGFLIGLGGSLGSSLGIKLNIWTLSLSPPFFFFLPRSLRQNQEAGDPYLLVDWKKEEENRKLRSTSHLCEGAFFLVHPQSYRHHRRADLQNRSLRRRDEVLKKEVLIIPAWGQAAALFCPRFLGHGHPLALPAVLRRERGDTEDWASPAVHHGPSVRRSPRRCVSPAVPGKL